MVEPPSPTWKRELKKSEDKTAFPYQEASAQSVDADCNSNQEYGYGFNIKVSPNTGVMAKAIQESDTTVLK
jgi:hypothetical protein